MSATGRTPAVGEVVAGYRLDEVVGSGGMGTVYRATHERIGKEFAVKILRPELAGDAVYRDRFEREARIAAQLDHPNVLTLVDFGAHQDALYLVMRFVRGHDLRRLLARVRVLGPRQTVDLLRQVAAGLDAAHAVGLVHRDVKPANVLVAAAGSGQRAGHAFLTDFGVAKDVSATGELTAPGTFVGSRHYASPEQLDARPVDGRADQYALACIAYECLTGAVPYERDTESAVMLAHLLEAPPSARAVLGNLPEAVDGVLARAMAKTPGERYPTCSEFVDALDEALGPPVAPASAPPLQAPVPDEAAPGPDEAGIRLGREEAASSRRGETELPGGAPARTADAQAGRPEPKPAPPTLPAPATPPAPSDVDTPSGRRTPRQPTVVPARAATVPEAEGVPPERAARRRPEVVFLLTAGLAAAGLVALAVGALTRGGGGSPPASTLRAVADSLTIAGRQRYLIQARALTANDRGRSPRIVGVAGGPGLHGAISLSRGASTLIYRPDPAYSGVASFTYTVRDAEGTLAVGHVRLTVTGFTNAQRALLAYVPSDVVGTCVAAARLGALARVQCRASVGALTFASYASKEQADRVFETSFVAPTGDCTRKPGTGTWYWPTSPKKDAGRYGCSLAGKLPRFGWTYSAARYFAIAVGPKGTTIAALARWFFVGARLKR